MWIRNVDFPAGLVNAHRAGNLVIFVGAGASMDPPAGLLNFVQLTRRIAAEAHVDVSATELEIPDRVLGRIKDGGVDVHHIIKTIIGDPASRPNELHRALARLATARPAVRIVTTNYDPHLSTAIRDCGVDVAEYRGPAVPLGDDFDGIVYLHGALTQDPRHLIATEADFGRAYLKYAWAARFVERMFAEYTVLFVGYSHNDTVMRLMARAIGAGNKKRYALTPDPDNEVWRTYGVVPVEYKIVSGSHAALAEAVDGWAALTSMGLRDHRQLVAQLVAGTPSLVPEDVSYLEAVLADPERVRFFAELADGSEWLSWAAQRPQFQAMFDPDAPYSPCTTQLADWFVERFAMVEALSAGALMVVHGGGGRLAPVLCNTLGQHLHRLSGPRQAWLGPWLMLLMKHAGEGHNRWLEQALLRSELLADREAALLLFDNLTEPRLRQRLLYAGGEPSFDVELRGSTYYLDKAWNDVFRPVLVEMAAAVLAIVDRQLRQMFGLLTIAGSARPGWDPVSFGRHTVEGPGDEFRTAADVVIDAARDCIEVLLRSGGPSGRGYLDTWAGSDVTILRRLALHGWICRSDIDATAKVTWLRERGWLFEHQLRPEVFRLIRAALPDASVPQADALVADAETAVLKGRDDEHIAYMRFNALTWMAQSAPDLRSARTALDALTSVYPHFVPRPDPDQFRSKIEVRVIPEQPPMPTDELHARIESDGSAAIAELRQYEDVEVPFDGPSWSDALQVLAATVHQYPADGFKVLDAIEPGSTDIVTSVIDGWSSSALNDETAVAVLRRLRSLDLAAAADSVARLLLGGIAEEANATKWHLLPEARDLAESLWSVLVPVEPPDDGHDWLTLSINRPAGRLADFWIRAVSADWTAAGDAWAGLPPGLSRPLETMLEGTDSRTWLAEVVLAGRVAFFFAADRRWCEAFLLPLMDWKTDEHRARRAWDGYLSIGRINDELFRSGLRDGYLATVAHADQLQADLRHPLISHLAAVAVYSTTSDPLTWTQDFTARADEEQRVEWMTQVAQSLRDLEPHAVEQQWQRWMSQYWQGRLDSRPIMLTTEEASALATWVAYLTNSLADGVGLATAHAAALSERHTLDDWTDARLAQEPALFAKLLAHLLKGTTPPFWDDVTRVALAVRSGADGGDFAIIRDEALRLGVSGAENW
jgi:hypothetical protein